LKPENVIRYQEDHISLREKNGQANFLSRRRRVLCVDDKELGLALQAMILEMNGYEVSVSDDPAHLVETFHKEGFELAVLDYQMPLINGGALAAFLKRKDPDLRIILFTGADQVPERELSFVDYVVYKSEGADALLTAIESLLLSEQRHFYVPNGSLANA